MTASTTLNARPPLVTRAIAALSAITFVLHLVVNLLSPYGFQRDEFLYMAMGRHLQFWRMDFPPFIALLSQVQRFLLGDSIVAIRFAPAVAAGASTATISVCSIISPMKIPRPTDAEA